MGHWYSPPLPAPIETVTYECDAAGCHEKHTIRHAPAHDDAAAARFRAAGWVQLTVLLPPDAAGDAGAWWQSYDACSAGHAREILAAPPHGGRVAP